MSKIIKYLPELEGEEQLIIAQVITDMTEDQAAQFATVYRQRRKDDVMMLLLTMTAFIGFAGVNRFVMKQVAMGLVYFFTAGFCLIGTIVDLFNYKSLTMSHNQKQALEVADLIYGAFPAPPKQLDEGAEDVE